MDVGREACAAGELLTCRWNMTGIAADEAGWEPGAENSRLEILRLRQPGGDALDIPWQLLLWLKARRTSSRKAGIRVSSNPPGKHASSARLAPPGLRPALAASPECAALGVAYGMVAQAHSLVCYFERKL
jgi:hypothetical protein